MSIFTRYNHKWAATKNLDSLKDQTTVKESLVRELKAERFWGNGQLWDAGAKQTEQNGTDEDDVIGFAVGGRDLGVDSDGGELWDDPGPDDDRSSEERRHRLVHQRVSLDEVEVGVRKWLGRVAAGAGSRTWNLERRINY